MRYCIVALLIAACTAHVVQAQPQNLEGWLNSRVDSIAAAVAAARVDMSDPAKRPQAPAGVSLQTPLVDRAAMPDIVGISVKLPSAAANGAVQPTTAAFSGSPIALIVGLLESRALDPSFYVNNRHLRRFALGIAYEQDEQSRPKTLFQAKYLIRDRGNPFANNQQIRDALVISTDAYTRLSELVRKLLWSRVGQRRFPLTVQGQIDFHNSLATPNVFQNTLNEAGPSAVAEIDAAINKEVDSFIVLQSALDEATAMARSQPLIAVGVTGELRENAARQVRAVAIWDVSRGRADFTANGGWNYTEAIGDAARINRAEVSAQFALRVSDENPLAGLGALTLSIAGSAGIDLDDSRTLVYAAQARVSLPLTSGVNVPLSATWSNRPELINENEVRGNIGFSFDLGQLLNTAR